ncbi:MFS transporter [Glycomyces sp. TRM65418]|uniref:MFS transporter n=1 Tax=Glycomyces sp. TRM65418 TaxID=2867006 RepID=UPI001CE572D5|nr:MFS transporter [Glycomyces sp. TRM65418]MCC3765935.1 MFS transporter [Glycomyces sp. TRM65418]QZD55517.1 MFS transporter [Glycomyces sp. TRM65418]
MTTVSPTAPPETRRHPVLGWIAVTAVACGTFTIVTTEMLPVGLLTLIGPDIGVSTGASGQLMTTASAAAVVSALAIMIVAGRLDRRLLLVGMMTVLLAANVMTALVDSYALLLAARVLVGLAIGGFWAIGAGLAVRLVPERSVARASSVILSGISIASVVGVPAGTLIGDRAGWRSAFGVMAALSLLVLIALAVLLPKLPSSSSLRPSDLTGLLRRGPVRAGLLGLLLIVIGHFAAYTYVTPVLRESAGLGGATIAVLLLVYGVAGIAGTFIAGALAGGRLREVVVGSAVLIAAATAAVPLAAHGTAAAALVLVVWGLGYGAVPVGLQVWNLRSDPEAPEGISALFVACFQVAIGTGAVVGGLAVDGIDITAPMWLGTLAAAATVALLLATARQVTGPK